jgi:hypothetical protein
MSTLLLLNNKVRINLVAERRTRGFAAITGDLVDIIKTG